MTILEDDLKIKDEPIAITHFTPHSAMWHSFSWLSGQWRLVLYFIQTIQIFWTAFSLK